MRVTSRSKVSPLPHYLDLCDWNRTTWSRRDVYVYAHHDLSQRVSKILGAERRRPEAILAISNDLEATNTLFQRAAPETCSRIGPQAKAQFQTSFGVYLNRTRSADRYA
jgi:hypothetical protein